MLRFGAMVPRADSPHPRDPYARDEASVRGSGGKHRQGSRSGARAPAAASRGEGGGGGMQPDWVFVSGVLGLGGVIQHICMQDEYVREGC